MQKPGAVVLTTIFITLAVSGLAPPAPAGDVHRNPTGVKEITETNPNPVYGEGIFPTGNIEPFALGVPELGDPQLLNISGLNGDESGNRLNVVAVDNAVLARVQVNPSPTSLNPAANLMTSRRDQTVSLNHSCNGLTGVINLNQAAGNFNHQTASTRLSGDLLKAFGF